MLLDRTATANAKPELEIFADDVKCAHGATVGELDKTALFYMASRGMEPGLARTLLLRSFIAGVFDDLVDDQVSEIGRESGRESVCRDVSFTVGAVTIKKKKNN